ncbi:hypothetical protein [Gorillibacterium sp. sgz5001074]|uniref:hypothetical protein n=1 Tax=Gorillibacterium sp. sgz5001074 TaxID=3446695 RepID=UPI003F675CDD
MGISIQKSEGRTDRPEAIVRDYIEEVLRLHEQGPLGETSPLFADGFHVDSREPFRWLCEGEQWTLSNLASQQNWLRTLCAMSAVSGDSGYRKKAEDTVRYAMSSLRYGKLLQWGGHLAYDLSGRRVVHAPDKGPQHELKCHYPFYELMFDVDPAGTKEYIEAYWNSHVTDWGNLEFSRHGLPAEEPAQGGVWDRVYAGGEPFFTAKGLTFINAGSDLYYAAGMLHRFTGDPKPLTWAKRLNGRYTDSRNPKTGMGGYQFSISVLPGVRGDRAIEQFGEQLKEHAPLEGTLSVARQVVAITGKAAICRMVMAEKLGAAGQEFADTALEDLLAYGTYTYDAEQNLIHPVLTNGTRLTGLIMEKSGYYGKAGEPLQAMPANALMLWSYALGYRISGEARLWSVIRGMAAGNGLGDFGADGRSSPQVKADTACADPYAIFALLELHKATGCKDYLKLADAVAAHVIRRHYHHGLFVRSEQHLYGKLDHIAPLALLHLAAEHRGIREELPSYCGGSAFFGSAYDGMGHMMDQQFYDSVMR